MMNDTTQFNRGGQKWLIATAVIFLVVFLCRFALRETMQTTQVYESMTHLSEEIAQSGKFYPLPFENAKPLTGRPDVPMPIPQSVYSKVELKINGKQIDGKLFTFPAGETVHIEGKIFGHRNLPQQVIMDGGISVVTRASNDLGWMIHPPHFFGGKMVPVNPHSSKSQQYCSFEGDYNFPKKTGEYLLVVISSAYLGLGDHPALLAAEYPLNLE